MNTVQHTYDGLAEGYDDYHTDGKSLAENRLVGAHLRALIGAQDQVIDLGCGTGLLLDLVDIPPERYLGVDISAGMLEHARRKHPGYEFVTGDLEAPLTNCAGRRFDVAVSLFGSPSYCELAPVANNVREVLEDDGRFFLMYCGPRYLTRSTYINREKILLRPRSEAELARHFPGARVWGMSALVDEVPTSWPRRVLDLLLTFDVRIPGRFAKDSCFFLNVEGTRYP